LESIRGHTVDFGGLDPADIVTMPPGAFLLRPSRALAEEITRSLKGVGVENPLEKSGVDDGLSVGGDEVMIFACHVDIP
jgi:hypothetical protein